MPGLAVGVAEGADPWGLGQCVGSAGPGLWTGGYDVLCAGVVRLDLLVIESTGGGE